MGADFFSSYFEYCKDQFPRLLSLLDKDKHSPTYGCFDRDYWLHKTKDFPSAAKQQGALGLAVLYRLDNGRSFSPSYLLQLLRASIEYTEKTQKRDGSFDEWYFNERGWAGPTAYIMHALCRVYFILEEDLPDRDKAAIKRILRKSAKHLCKSDEYHIIANHIAIAMAAAFQTSLILKDKDLENLTDKLKAQLLLKHSKEGWSLEYDGFDVGYQTATITFLTHILARKKDPELEELVKTSYEFISYFLGPQAQIFNSLSSRQTTTHFYAGNVFWKDKIATAATIAAKTEEFRTFPLPHHQEDHYFLYRLPEMMDACLISMLLNERRKEINKSSPSPLPVERKEPFVKNFPEAGVLIVNDEKSYTLINYKKGAAVASFKKSTGKTVLDTGVAVIDSKGKIFTCNSSNSCEGTAEGTSVKSNGLMTSIPSPYFSPAKLIFFRLLMMLIGWNAKLAYISKNGIKSLLITNTKTSSIAFVRNIEVKDGTVKITTKISMPLGSYDIVHQGSFHSRYVPQSRYHTTEEAENTPLRTRVKNQRTALLRREI